jgi:hypothetical protein
LETDAVIVGQLLFETLGKTREVLKVGKEFLFELVKDLFKGYLICGRHGGLYGVVVAVAVVFLIWGFVDVIVYKTSTAMPRG